MRRVTQVIGTVIPFRVRENVDESEVRFWCERGQAVHKATELFDRGDLDFSTVDPIIRGRLDGWRRFRTEIGGKCIAIEQEVSSEKLGYAGRLDRIIRGCAMFPLDDVLLDIKSGKPTATCKLQTMAYKMALKRRSNRKLRRMAVELRDNGTYDVPEVYADDNADTVGWLGCLWVHGWMERNGLV